METPTLLIELGAVLVGLAVLARLAVRLSLPTIPLYLIAGLAFGKGGLLPLVVTEEFIQIGAEIGLILLLFMLGLQYSARELVNSLRTTLRPGLLDFVLNFVPGFLGGLVLGWGYVPALFLGGVTFVSSSGVAAKLLNDLPGTAPDGNRFVLSILIFEDLAMALYLPTMAAVVIGETSVGAFASAAIAIGAVVFLILAALRLDVGISRLIFSKSDEAMLLTIMGLTILVAGLAESIQVSAAVGALLVGILLSGPAAHAAESLLAPLRDLFAALFFAFLGLSIDASTLGSAVLPAAVLSLVTMGSKFLSTMISAKWSGLPRSARVSAAAILLTRGEFSIVVAGLGVAAGIEPDLGPLAIAYVLMMIIAGPLLTRVVHARTAASAASPRSSHSFRKK